jgi:uncharacterized protein (DUF305 family)
MRSLCSIFIAASVAGCGAATANVAAGTGAGSGELSAAEIEALFEARTDSALTRFTAADVSFVTDMIAHHAQALTMAELASSHGASARVQTLAARILNGQRDEIDRMQLWLQDRDQRVPDPPVDLANATSLAAEHAGHMPGMLTPEQLNELDRARGAEFDRLFLTYMIQHHRGAITMVHELFGTDGAAQDASTYKLASDIQVDQTTEIARMQSMLDAQP